MQGKSYDPTPEHKAFMTDLKEAIAKHPHLTGLEMLALTSQLVGNLVAFQDQTQYSPAAVMETVARNIEIGNAVAVASTFANPQGQA